MQKPEYWEALDYHMSMLNISFQEGVDLSLAIAQAIRDAIEEERETWWPQFLYVAIRLDELFGGNADASRDWLDKNKDLPLGALVEKVNDACGLR